jgi:hypothetical protein
MRGEKMIDLGEALTKEQWNRVGDTLELIAPIMGEWLKRKDYEGLGAKDKEEFLGNMHCAIVAIRYVAEFATDKCMFLVVKDEEEKP